MNEFTSINYPNAGLDDGAGTYCRNPDGKPYVWCKTEDPDQVWEYCVASELDGIWDQSGHIIVAS